MSDTPAQKPHQLSKGLTFESFLIAFGEGSSRARKIINVLTITSIASLLGLLNSLMVKWNWFTSRQEKMAHLYHVIRFDEDTTKDSIFYKLEGEYKTLPNRFQQEEFSNHLVRYSKGQIKSSDLKNKYNLRPWLHFKFPKFVLKDSILKDYASKDSLKVSIIDTNELIKNKSFLVSGYNMACISYLASQDELNRTIQAMARANLENSKFVRIPILGIAFDVNWLIIASGAGFVAMYFLLYYSLSRERKNIRLVFKVGIYENISIARLYQFMSMQQVFTIPQSINEYLENENINEIKKEQPSNKFSINATQLYSIFPFVIWTAIFFYDLITKEIGQVLNNNLTTLQFYTSIIIGFVMFLLVRKCFIEAREIDKEWLTWTEYIRKEEEARKKNDAQN